MTSPAASPSSRIERRQAVRHTCRLIGDCRPVTPAIGPVDRFATHDLSRTGAALLCPRPYDKGTLLEIELRSSGHSIACRRLLLVVHQRASGDGQWLVGGLFYTELSPDELHALCA
jgi:hypothetical protein